MAQGDWARKFCPRDAYTVYDLADRLGLSVDGVRDTLDRHKIPTTRLVRRVRIAPGVVKGRLIRVISQSALETLILKRHGAK
jgi:hypothetical protein